MNAPRYVVKRRQLRENLDESTSLSVYLGRDGRWHRSASHAEQFSSLPAAEAALQETWRRLRNGGERLVILSVMKVPA